MQSLWLLLHCLSFILLVIFLVWESVQQFENINNTNMQNYEKNIQLILLQLTAYSLHCIGNPIIMILQNPKIAKILIDMLSCKRFVLKHFFELKFFLVLTHQMNMWLTETLF